MKIFYRPAAIEDIQRVSDYLENVLKNKYEEVDSDYRFITINKQLVFYEINDDIIEIVRIIDGRTDYMTHIFE